MVLYTKCILDPPTPEGGLRISVMSRHTLIDGTTPHPGITPESYHEHMKVLAPPFKLVRKYYAGKLLWVQFVEQYLERLRTHDTQIIVRTLALHAVVVDVTLLCVGRAPEFSQRLLLAEECKRLVPWLHVEHR